MLRRSQGHAFFLGCVCCGGLALAGVFLCFFLAFLFRLRIRLPNLFCDDIVNGLLQFLGLLLFVLDVLLDAAFFFLEFGHLSVELFLFLLKCLLLCLFVFQHGSLFLAGLLAGFHFATDLLFNRGDLIHLEFAGIVEFADITQSAEGLVEVFRGKDEPQSVVLAAVFVRKNNHFGVFLLQLAEVGVEGLDVALS